PSTQPSSGWAASQNQPSAAWSTTSSASSASASSAGPQTSSSFWTSAAPAASLAPESGGPSTRGSTIAPPSSAVSSVKLARSPLNLDGRSRGPTLSPLIPESVGTTSKLLDVKHVPFTRDNGIIFVD